MVPESAKVPIKSSVWLRFRLGSFIPLGVGNPIWKNNSSIPGLQSWYRRLSRSIRRTERLRPKTDKLRLPTNTNLSVRLHDRVPSPFSRAPLPLTHATTRQDGRHHEHFRRRQGRQGPQGERSAVAPVAANRVRRLRSARALERRVPRSRARAGSEPDAARLDWLDACPVRRYRSGSNARARRAARSPAAARPGNHRPVTIETDGLSLPSFDPTGAVPRSPHRRPQGAPRGRRQGSLRCLRRRGTHPPSIGTPSHARRRTRPLAEQPKPSVSFALAFAKISFVNGSQSRRQS